MFDPKLISGAWAVIASLTTLVGVSAVAYYTVQQNKKKVDGVEKEILKVRSEQTQALFKDGEAVYISKRECSKLRDVCSNGFSDWLNSLDERLGKRMDAHDKTMAAMADSNLQLTKEVAKLIGAFKQHSGGRRKL